MKKLKHRYKIILFFGMLLLTFSLAATAYAHGVVITYALKSNGQVELVAEFDTGERMANAQVTIYSPEDPLNPWLTGAADAEGRYVFVIDPDMPGIWDIQYRKAGHGDIVHLQLEAGMIDPVLLEQAPGALLPETPATRTTPAETTPEADMPVDEKAETTENVVDTADETTATESNLASAEIEAAAGEPGAAEPEPEPQETLVEAAEQAAAPVVEAESALEPEPAAQAEVAPQAEAAAETEMAAPKPAARPEEAVVLTSGGNTATTGGFTSLQIILMSASVIWGFMGTALYFSNKKRPTHNHEHAPGHHH